MLYADTALSKIIARASNLSSTPTGFSTACVFFYFEVCIKIAMK